MWPRLYLIDSICVNKYKAICFHVLGFKFQSPKDKLCKTQVVSKSLVLHFSHVWGMYINIRDYLLRIRNSSKTFDYPTSLRSKLSYYISIKNTSSCTFRILDVDIIILWYTLYLTSDFLLNVLMKCIEKDII